jgi:uncharacterized coiled-coil protein SlyX
MKKLLIIIIVFLIFLIGCNSESVNNSDLNTNKVTQLEEQLVLQAKDVQSKEEALTLKSQQIDQLEKRINELTIKFEQCNTQVALGKGYAIQFMLDIDEMYNYLQCPQLPTTDDKTTKVMNQLIQKLSQSENYSNKKIVSLKISESNNSDEGHYTFEVLMFTPKKEDQLLQLIDNSATPPFPAIRL